MFNRQSLYCSLQSWSRPPSTGWNSKESIVFGNCYHIFDINSWWILWILTHQSRRSGEVQSRDTWHSLLVRIITPRRICLSQIWRDWHSQKAWIPQTGRMITWGESFPNWPLIWWFWCLFSDFLFSSMRRLTSSTFNKNWWVLHTQYWKRSYPFLGLGNRTIVEQEWIRYQCIPRIVKPLDQLVHQSSDNSYFQACVTLIEQRISYRVTIRVKRKCTGILKSRKMIEGSSAYSICLYALNIIPFSLPAHRRPPSHQSCKTKVFR